jgi:hypothetical protein
MAPTSAIKPLRWSALGADTRNVMPDLVLAQGSRPTNSQGADEEPRSELAGVRILGGLE